MKISAQFFTQIEKIILKFILKHKRPWRAQTILDNKNSVVSISSPDSSYTTDYSNKNALVLCINRDTLISGIELRIQIKAYDPKISNTWFKKKIVLWAQVYFLLIFQIVFQSQHFSFPFPPPKFQYTPSLLFFKFMFSFLTHDFWQKCWKCTLEERQHF